MSGEEGPGKPPLEAARKNRRRVARLSGNESFRAAIRMGGGEWPAAIRDLSPLGIGLRGTADQLPPLRPDMEIQVKVTFPGGERTRPGRVVWVRNLPGEIVEFGVEFLRESPSSAGSATVDLRPAEEEELSAPSQRAPVRELGHVPTPPRKSDTLLTPATPWRKPDPGLDPEQRFASSGPLDMSRVKIDPSCAMRIPAEIAQRHQILPFVELRGRVYVACADPRDTAAVGAVERHLNQPVQAVAAEPQSLRRLIQRVFSYTQIARDAQDPVGMVTETIHAAHLRQASDIHIDPERDAVRVRFRVDGAVEEYRKLPNKVFAEFMSRIKVLAGLDISEKRAPQDGRFTHHVGPEEALDIRVAVIPTKYGERANLRLVHPSSAMTLETLGMSATDLAAFREAIRAPHGMVLATGPTGCGKSTTLYAALRRITSAGPSIVVSVQDPVEFDIPGTAQVEVDTAGNLTFAKALRSILRHDPDVIMIGEIRDQETTDIAVKAALTGHLVLATLHSNTAVNAITRLQDMGVDRYLLGTTLRLVSAQRIVRRTCGNCRRPVRLTAEQARWLKRPEIEGMTVYEPEGCLYCAGKGYAGRIGLFELLPVDREMGRAIVRGIDEPGLADMLRQRRIPSMMEDAIEKMGNGLVTFEEVLAAVSE